MQTLHSEADDDNTTKNKHDKRIEEGTEEAKEAEAAAAAAAAGGAGGAFTLVAATS
jgi:hypothetical protein